MAIHPKYAEAILSGRKRIEFRKRSLASDISDVLIYATRPVQRIVGRFKVAEVVCDTPVQLWAEYGDLGAITRSDFVAYYSGALCAYGFLVAHVERFPVPYTLQEMWPQPAVPQSISYLSEPASLLAGS